MRDLDDRGVPARTRPRIALLMHGLGYAYQDSILRGVHDACQARGWDVLCLTGGVLSADDPHSAVYSLVGAGDIDGLIVAAGSMGVNRDSPDLTELFGRFLSVPRCSIAVPHENAPSVVIDNAEGVYGATRHLIEQHERRRLAFLGGRGAESIERLEGFRRAHADSGLALDPSRIIEGDYLAESGAAAVARFGRPDHPTVDGLVAANDWMAMGALEEAERRGFRVPEQLAIVGFDDSDQARFTTPPLTTVGQPILQLGEQAVQVIEDQLLGRAVKAVRYLRTRLVVRHSCGCITRAIAPGPEVFEPGALLPLLRRHRDYCRRALASAAPPHASALDSAWADSLLDALELDLAGRSGAFHAAADTVLQRAAGLGSVTLWHDVFSSLRGAAIRMGVTDIREWFCFESLVESIHVLIGSHAERAQGRRRIAKEVQLHALESFGNAARTALDFSGIGRSLAEHLNAVGIRRCWLTRLGGAVSPSAESRLVVACDASEGARSVDGEAPFLASQILPDQCLLPEPLTYVIQPMVFASETLGMCIISHDSGDPSIYPALAAPLTAAVKAAQLFETVVEEVTRRERAERGRLEQEMAIAQRIQTAIFPKRFDVPGLELSASMDPATEVGGDYFDVLPAADGCWLGIGDVAGHGLPTGLVALMIQSIVAGMARHGSDSSPIHIWRDLNSVLCENVRTRLGQDEHATLTLIRYSTDGRLRLAGAHEEIIVLRAGASRAETIETHGAWVGVTTRLPPEALTEDELQLSPGDLMLLYTDGVTEARNAERKMFGLDRLCRLLEEHRSEAVEPIRLSVLEALRAWSSERSDDVTVAVVRYRGVSS